VLATYGTEGAGCSSQRLSALPPSAPPAPPPAPCPRPYPPPAGLGGGGRDLLQFRGPGDDSPPFDPFDPSPAPNDGCERLHPRPPGPTYVHRAPASMRTRRSGAAEPRPARRPRCGPVRSAAHGKGGRAGRHAPKRQHQLPRTARCRGARLGRAAAPDGLRFRQRGRAAGRHQASARAAARARGRALGRRSRPATTKRLRARPAAPSVPARAPLPRAADEDLPDIDLLNDSPAPAASPGAGANNGGRRLLSMGGGDGEGHCSCCGDDSDESPCPPDGGKAGRLCCGAGGRRDSRLVGTQPAADGRGCPHACFLRRPPAAR
jgi:hypothetical protein